MRIAKAAIVFPLASSLWACGSGEQQVVREDGEAVISDAQNSAQTGAPAQFNSCEGRAAPRDLCQDKDAVSAAGAVRDATLREIEQLSPEGRRIAADGVRAWTEAQAAVCRTESAPAACFLRALRKRRDEVGESVAIMGGYTIQTVEIADAVTVTPEAAQKFGFGAGDAIPGALMRSIRYPRIDNPERDPAIERFNALAAPERASGPQDLVEETIDYQVAYAGPSLVSVRFQSYEYSLGAAHPNSSERAVTVLLPEGVLLRPETAFRSGSGWEQALTEQAMRKLAPVFEEFGAGPPEPSDVRDTVAKAHNWVVTEDALIILFAPYSIGPHALGGHEVAIPWSALRPYLNPDAPAPIGQGQG